MNDKEFHVFCRVLKFSTNVSLFLMLIVVVLMPFSFVVADNKPWVGLFAFLIFVLGFYNNHEDKKKFIAGERVSKGHHGITGVMFSLWQNIAFWFLYISMELLMAGMAISILAKAIWPN